MHRDEATRITYTWLGLCFLTVLSAVVTLVFDGGDASTAVGLVVLAMGATKAFFILHEFMEVRECPTWLKVFAWLWLAGLMAAITVLYLQ